MRARGNRGILDCMAKLIQTLPDGPLDIIGDVHGEADALRSLLARLGCDPVKKTAERPLVFVGDLVDRGPDSVAVVALVKGLVEAGLAQCVLGNHELNILFGSRKEGNGWIRADTSDHYQFKDGDEIRQESFDSVPATPRQAEEITAAFKTLPLVLQRSDLRVVHACWHSEGISRLPEEGDIAALGREWASRFTAIMRPEDCGLLRRRSAMHSPISHGLTSGPRATSQLMQRPQRSVRVSTPSRSSPADARRVCPSRTSSSSVAVALRQALRLVGSL